MRRRPAVVLALVAVLATTALVLALTRSAGAGPFADAGGWGVGMPVKVGQVAATTIVLPRTLTKPAVLLGVHPLHPEDATGLTLRYAATIGRGLEIAGGRGWNTSYLHRYQLRPLPGFVVPAHRRGGVTVAAASKHPGVYTLNGFVIDYRIGGTRFSAPVNMTFTICAGPDWWPVKAGSEVRSCHAQDQ